MNHKLAHFISIIFLSISLPVLADVYLPIPILKKPNKSQFTKTRVIKTDKFESDVKELLLEGYVPIKSDEFDGSTSFGSYELILRNMEKKAHQLGAQVILFSNEESSSAVGYVTYMTQFSKIPKNQSDFESFNNSPNSTGNGSLIRQSPKYIGKKEYIVSYFYKFESITGVYPVDLSDRDQSRTGQLTGVKAKVIKETSKAFGQILEDDIILKINDMDVRDVSHFVDISNYLKKGNTQFEILRKGQRLVKEFSID